MPVLVGLAAIYYGSNVLWVLPFPIDKKLLFIFRDLIIILLSVGIVVSFKKNKVLFFGLLALGIILFKLFYFPMINKPFAGNDPNLSDAYEIIIETKDDAMPIWLQPLQEKYGLTVDRLSTPQDFDATELDNFFLIGIPDKNEFLIERIEDKLEDFSEILWIERNEVVRVEDPVGTLKKHDNTRYGVNDPEVRYQWGLDKLKMDEYYTLLRTSKIKPQRPARVFVLDTGVDATHEDLQLNYKSHSTKYDTDGSGHGTHCAGVIGAVTNNGLGIASMALNPGMIEISGIKVLGSNGAGTQAGIIRGIIEAVDGGADVISMSLGGRSSQTKQRTYNEAFQYATEHGVIVVVAAGNNGGDARNISPANTEGVITVTAVNEDLNRAPFSNHITNIERGIAAPGTNIYSTLPGDKYTSMNGTSMAAPRVSALAGILKSYYPELTYEEFYEIIHDTGMETGDNSKTGRLIQPEKALKKLMSEYLK